MVLWFVVTEGAPFSAMAVVSVAAALAATLVLARGSSPRFRFASLVPVVFSFLLASLRGGVDVAWRALHLRRPIIAPAVVDYRLRVTRRHERALVAALLTLVPGTLSAGLAGNRMQMHVLDARTPAERMLRQVEDWVTALYRRPRDALPRDGGD